MTVAASLVPVVVATVVWVQHVVVLAVVGLPVISLVPGLGPVLLVTVVVPMVPAAWGHTFLLLRC